MRNFAGLKFVLLPLLVITIAAGSTAGERREAGERRRLLEQQKVLTGRIEGLTRDQDYLLFLKTMSSTDTKYLVLTLSNRTGRLKYKNRILRDFRFSAGRARTRLPGGAVVLAKKKELPGGRKQLVFGTSFVVHRKGMEPARDKAAPGLSLSKRDFKAVFAALEEGAPAYVLP